VPGWGGALLPPCFQSLLAPFRSKGQLCLRSDQATHAPKHRSSAPTGSHTGAPPAREGLGGSTCPRPPGRESPPAKRGAEPFLATSRFCHLPFQTCPVNPLNGFFPP